MCFRSIMCPSAPISELLDFKACSTDEEYILFLGAIEVGDPIPENMIIDVNPFMVEPWSSPENSWYLYNLEDQGENGENDVRVTKFGYWKIMDAHRISTIGNKTILEFYEGQAPCGKKTGWMMHEYQVEQKAQGFNTAQNYCYLSRVLQSGQSSNSEELDRHLKNADLHCGQLESYLLCLAEQEENNFLSQETIDKSQMVLGDQWKVTDSNRLADERTTENSAEEMHALYDFSREDFLEMNDLLSLDSSSTSSDNSSNMSINSDEYFDADALLRDLQNENNLSMEVEHADCRFSISASVQSNRVIVSPPEPGLVRDRSSDIMVAESMPGNSVPDDGQDSHQTVSLPTTEHNEEGASPSASPQDSQVNHTVTESSQGSKFPLPTTGLQHNDGALSTRSQNIWVNRIVSESSQYRKSPLLTTGLQHNEGASPSARLQNSRVNRTLSESSQDRKSPLPTIGLQHNEGASPSSSSENSRVNRTFSESSQDSKSPPGQGTRSVSKIAKLGKYCCFVSFCP
ncbi:uncharacterized protein [Typha angustifolia]|uniref:uncharacterized protein isoform X1 n=3 Tax=Typha angustifolia TaxID=59011 RepID=UPI003C2C7DE3